MIYTPGTDAPYKLPALVAWLVAELRRVAAALHEPEPRTVLYTKLTAPPAKLFDGLTAYADGATWNPGSGAGLYIYRGGAWNFLG